MIMQAVLAKRKRGRGMDKRKNSKKFKVRGRFFKLYGFPMRWRAVLRGTFEMFAAWLNYQNQYRMT